MTSPILKLSRGPQPPVISLTYKNTTITPKSPMVLDVLVSGTTVKNQILEQDMLLAPYTKETVRGTGKKTQYISYYSILILIE